MSDQNEEKLQQLFKEHNVSSWEDLIKHSKEKLLPHLETSLNFDWQSVDQETQEIFDKIDQLRSKAQPPTVQNFFEYIETIDYNAHKDPKRVGLLKEISLNVQKIAQDFQNGTGGKLDWDVLLNIQKKILQNEDIDYRQGEAFGKKNTERYTLWKEQAAMFKKKIKLDSQDLKVHPISNAVRTYIDFCYFHPFPDGNGRAGFIWLFYLLMRSNIPFPKNFFVFRLMTSMEDFAGNSKNYKAAILLLGKLCLKTMEG